MSRIGNQIIEIPQGVTVSVASNKVNVKGSLGALDIDLRSEVSVKVDGSTVAVTTSGDSRTEKALHGLTRSLIANMVEGVSKGFEKKLEIVGVGYKADVKGDVVNLNLGFSHPIDYKLPKGIKAVADKGTSLTITGFDKQLVGQVAADIRSYRKPEPYKGKGIKYSDEIIRRKAGKAAK